jgi:hypothetical protein
MPPGCRRACARGCRGLCTDRARGLAGGDAYGGDILARMKALVVGGVPAPMTSSVTLQRKPAGHGIVLAFPLQS